MAATIKIRWTVSNLENVMTLYDVQKVYMSTTQSGTYNEITDGGSRVALEADQTDYYYDDTSGDSTYWYKISYFNSVSSAESSLTAAIPATGGGRYVTVQEMRDAGFVETLYSNVDLLRAIMNAERFVERLTGNVFIPQQRTFRMDPNPAGSNILLLDMPIVQIDAVTIVAYVGDDYTDVYDISVDDVKVYNRHLTQGLVSPDDRDNPRLILLTDHWGHESQSIKLEGWFGYTELGIHDTPGETVEGSQLPSSKGGPPELLTRAIELLLPRFLASPADPDEYDDATRRHHIERYKARDQEVQYAKGTAATGGITGDQDVDAFLEHFLEPQATGELV